MIRCSDGRDQRQIMMPIGKKRKKRSKVDIILPERIPAKGHVWKSVAGPGANGFTISSHYLGVHWHRAAKKWVRRNADVKLCA